MGPQANIPGLEAVAMCGIFSVDSWIFRYFSWCVSMSHVCTCLWGLHMYLQRQRTTMDTVSHLFFFFLVLKTESFIDLELLSLPPQHWDVQACTATHGFLCGFWGLD